LFQQAGGIAELVLRPYAPQGREANAKINPIELSDLISIEYEQKVRSKPNWDIQRDINTLQRFSTHFSTNMYGYVPFSIRAGWGAKQTQVD
jgi:hypothetical protein